MSAVVVVVVGEYSKGFPEEVLGRRASDLERLSPPDERPLSAPERRLEIHQKQ